MRFLYASNFSSGAREIAVKARSARLGRWTWKAVETVGDRRAAWAACFELRAEHEVVDEELRVPVEQLGERLLPTIAVEGILLLNTHPRKLTTLPRQLVALTCVLLLARPQLPPGSQPLVARSDLVLGHPLSSCVR